MGSSRIQKFTATLNKEGSTGSVRGKIPATLVASMGGDDGDIMEFEVSGKTLVGGRIIRGQEARKLRSQRQNFGNQGGSNGTAKKTEKKEAGTKKSKAGTKKSSKNKMKLPSKPVKSSKSKSGNGKASGKAKSSKAKTSVKFSPNKKKGQKSKGRFELGF